MNLFLATPIGGRSLAGDVFGNEQLAASVSNIAQNLSTTTSNINQLGLWRVLWRPQPPQTNAPPGTHSLLAPGDPRRR